jgi:hypothetical protein
MTFVEKGDEIYRYVGSARTLDLSSQNYGGDDWAAALVHRSDVGSSFRRNLDGKFYVIKPRELDSPRLVYTNVGNKLIERSETLRGWIVSHGGNAQAVARYQAELEQIEQTLKDLGIAETLGTEGGALVAPKNLDVFLLDLPSRRKRLLRASADNAGVCGDGLRGAEGRVAGAAGPRHLHRLPPRLGPHRHGRAERRPRRGRQRRRHAPRARRGFAG